MLPNITDIKKDAWRDGGGSGAGGGGEKTIVKEQFNTLLPFPPLSQENLNVKGKNGDRICDSRISQKETKEA